MAPAVIHNYGLTHNGKTVNAQRSRKKTAGREPGCSTKLLESPYLVRITVNFRFDGGAAPPLTVNRTVLVPAAGTPSR